MTKYCFRFPPKHHNLSNTDTNEEISCCVLNIYSHIYKDVFLYYFDNKKVKFVQLRWAPLKKLSYGNRIAENGKFICNIAIMHA